MEDIKKTQWDEAASRSLAQYNQAMNQLEIEAFARRDRELAAWSKVAYWAAQFRRDRQSTWNAAQLLLTHARVVLPDFPSQQDRELDLAAHLSLRSALDRPSNAFTRR